MRESTSDRNIEILMRYNYLREKEKLKQYRALDRIIKDMNLDLSYITILDIITKTKRKAI
jgi:hypothetical protein